MSTRALCFTPDASHFRQAVGVASSALAQEDSYEFDVLLVCAAEDIALGIDRLESSLSGRITLCITDWRAVIGEFPRRNHLPSASWRRLALHQVIPQQYTRFAWLDADTWVEQPGIAAALSGNMLGHAVAAVPSIHTSLCSLTGEFAQMTSGFSVVDRASWETGKFGELALRYGRLNIEHCHAADESALNEVLRGRFAPLSTRYNWMVEFAVALPDVVPVIRHWRGWIKPWDYANWHGDKRWCNVWRDWFRNSPWPELAEG